MSWLLRSVLVVLALWASSASAQVTKTQEIGAAGGETVEVLVTNAAGGSYVPATPLTGRRGLELQNLGVNTIYCTLDGSAPLATGANGRRLLVGETWAPPASDKVLVRCISATAAQTTTAGTMVTEFK